jgi:hypothetical protein
LKNKVLQADYENEVNELKQTIQDLAASKDKLLETVRNAELHTKE